MQTAWSAARPVGAVRDGFVFKALTLALIGTSLLPAPIEYEEIAELAGPPAPVSDTIAAPFGAKVRENAPGPTLAVMVMGESVPSG